MSEEILNKIKYLCKNIPKVEWSGALFYSVEGSIKQPETFKIILEDILPLDMGTQAYTTYELDDRYLDYMMDDIETRGQWTVGHIHSHNTMAVFFSGTDMDELNDNAPNHNYYLSLIVNNFMDFTAKVAFTASIDKVVKNVPYKALDDNGKEYIVSKTDLTYKKTKLFTYDCEIISPKEEVHVEDIFNSRVVEIMKPKTVAPVVNKPAVTDKPVVQLKPEHAKIVNKLKFPPKLEVDKLSDRGKVLANIVDKIPYASYEDLTVSDTPDPIEIFLGEVMNFSNPLANNQNLEDVLDILGNCPEVDAYALASSVLNYYLPLYEKHFPDSTDEEFVINSEIACDILYDLVPAYPFINVTVEAINALVKQYEKDNVTTTAE